jgi:hypothetical protein
LLLVNAGLLLLALVVAAYGGEAWLVFQATRPPHPEVPGFDRRGLLEVVRALEAEGLPVVPALYGANAYRDPEAPEGGLLPLCGIATATTVFCNESGAWVRFTSDGHGFNNPDARTSSSARVALAIVGDSYAEGQCVPPGQEAAGWLRAHGCPSVNLGCSGDGPLMELATLIEYALPLRPRAIAWLYYEGNDPADLTEELALPRLTAYLDDPRPRGLVRHQAELDSYWRTVLQKRPAVANERAGPSWREILTLFHLRARLGLRRADWGPLADPLRRVLARARAAAEQAQARLIFVYLPSFSRLHGWGFRDRRPEVLSVARELGLEVIDFAAIVAADPDPDRFYPLRGIGHFSPAGHARLGEALLNRCPGAPGAPP